jgi:hypothetical protein
MSGREGMQRIEEDE